jgi:hypothetical protein
MLVKLEMSQADGKTAAAATHSSACRCQSGPLGKRVLACRRCGCRMVTKVGGRGNLLICSDCGVPVENLQGQLQHRQRLYAALSLICLTLVGGMIFLLAAMEERLAPWATQTGQSKGGAQNGYQSPRLPEPALLAPDPKPTASISSPALPIKHANAKHVRELGLGKPDHLTLPLPRHQRTQPRDHRPES